MGSAAPPHDIGWSPKHASSRETAGGKPGVENMLGHAPPPLTASGLDMRDGHPAESAGTTSEVLTPRRRETAPFKDRVGEGERKGFVPQGGCGTGG